MQVQNANLGAKIQASNEKIFCWLGVACFRATKYQKINAYWQVFLWEYHGITIQW
jgi:hypothetical protein